MGLSSVFEGPGALPLRTRQKPRKVACGASQRLRKRPRGSGVGMAVTGCLAAPQASARSKATSMARATGSTTSLALGTIHRHGSTSRGANGGSVARLRLGLLAGERRGTDRYPQ